MLVHWQKWDIVHSWLQWSQFLPVSLSNHQQLHSCLQQRHSAVMKNVITNSCYRTFNSYVSYKLNNSGSSLYPWLKNTTDLLIRLISLRMDILLYFKCSVNSLLRPYRPHFGEQMTYVLCMHKNNHAISLSNKTKNSVEFQSYPQDISFQITTWTLYNSDKL